MHRTVGSIHSEVSPSVGAGDHRLSDKDQSSPLYGIEQVHVASPRLRVGLDKRADCKALLLNI